VGTFGVNCASVFASDEQRSAAHVLAGARAAGSAAAPRDLEVVANAVDALLFATAPDDAQVLTYGFNVFKSSMVAVKAF